jgi:molecular chaperone DnaK
MGGDWASAATVPVDGGRTAVDLGIETKGGTFTPLIERFTAVPANRTETFTTSEDNQTTIRIDVYRGLSTRVADAQRVGGYALTVPNLVPRGVPQLAVTFEIDAAGTFRLTAADVGTGAPVTVSLLD